MASDCKGDVLYPHGYTMYEASDWKQRAESAEARADALEKALAELAKAVRQWSSSAPADIMDSLALAKALNQADALLGRK